MKTIEKYQKNVDVKTWKKCIDATTFKLLNFYAITIINKWQIGKDCEKIFAISWKWEDSYPKYINPSTN